MLPHNIDRDQIANFSKDLLNCYCQYLNIYVKAFQRAKKFFRWWCLHYEDCVIREVFEMKKVMLYAHLFMTLQNELDKQRIKASINYVKIQKATSRNAERRSQNHNRLESLKQVQRDCAGNDDLDILYNACLVFAMGFISIPLVQVTLVLFFPLWVLVFIFVVPPLIIAGAIITLTLSIIKCMTQLKVDVETGMNEFSDYQ